MRTIAWNLNIGNNPLQQQYEAKKKEGLDYIEKIKSDGEIVTSVVEEPSRILITLADKSDEFYTQTPAEAVTEAVTEEASVPVEITVETPVDTPVEAPTEVITEPII